MSIQEQVDTIGELIGQLDALALEEPAFASGPGWEPQTARGRRIFQLLASPEHRDALRLWYARFRGKALNPVAENLRQALERATGESLR